MILGGKRCCFSSSLRPKQNLRLGLDHLVFRGLLPKTNLPFPPASLKPRAVFHAAWQSVPLWHQPLDSRRFSFPLYSIPRLPYSEFSRVFPLNFQSAKLRF